MEFDWDDDKAASNLDKHGVAFEVVYELNWDQADARIDGRRAYGEVRLQALVQDGDGRSLLRRLHTQAWQGPNYQCSACRKTGDGR